ncbi:MAG: type ISP restriction/modification enzyme [Polyangiales bacterium]
MTQTIHTILDQFRREATSNRDLGDRFERLICRYLELDPLYSDRFSRVWMWNDWPLKGHVGDVGIDLVAEERATGEYCAIQCKFYLPDHTLSKQDIDSFFTAAGKKQFSSCMIVSTTDKWGSNAEDALKDQSKPVTRLRVQDLDDAPIDWSRFSLKRPQDLSLRRQKAPREHQKTAIRAILDGFAKADRGKLIMACGTGKTFTALSLACEIELVPPHGHVLFLVPSLSLLSQSLREWTAESTRPIHALAVCSDTKIGKRSQKGEDDTADITTHDLAFPATTSAGQITRQYQKLKTLASKEPDQKGMTVVFSTYQSIDAVSEAQKAGLPPFDLIICDEAHRTTGVTLSSEDESHFVKVHDAKFLRGRKRLYMTATPRIYSDETKSKVKEAEAELCSMDDRSIFGEEFYRLGFGEAVAKGLLSDYKVLVLAVDEKYVSKAFQRQIADANNELNLADAVKIVGCWNGLAKRLDRITAAADLHGDTAPMRRAVAFSRSIRDSKAFTQTFRQVIDEYRKSHPDEQLINCELDHVDGTFDAMRRNALLDWLKATAPADTCRVLSNARCLSEGVDVPALDAVLFLNPRKSVIDVVQSVGRVMRRAESKKYGYIILPIGIPADVAPEEALKDNEKYKVVWQVLQALRAHDDRFNATINQIELNAKRPDSIQVIGVGDPGDGDGDTGVGDGTPGVRDVQMSFGFADLEAWKDAIFARIVLKCGDRRYWESWAKDVATIAERHTTRIKALLDGAPRHRKAFSDFLAGLRLNINPSISEDDAIEMLSQHLITRPVFDALFAGYAFTKHNPVSIAMQKMLDALEDQTLEKETNSLAKFYDSVRERAAGIDNAVGRQKVVIELYDKFFRTAFPKMAERLGIVYTPVEVVDFIIRSVDAVLRHEFNSSISDKDVHVIDPFTGTGTFIVRLLQSGLIQPEDLRRKYQHELHANEIVLLAYYIAAINIEETFHALLRTIEPSATTKATASGDAYMPFEGIVLTDTFQLAETKGALEERMFPENNRRVRRQKQSPIRVVIGNPPYSTGQDSQNDNNKNLVYEVLDGRIGETYTARSNAKLSRNLYDSYVRALRWASDRVGDKGVVSFVTNNSFLDGNAMDGLRASLIDEFSTIYVFNLRGNQRTSGETSRMEGGKIFGSGSRAGIAISLLIRNPAKTGACELHYHDIGDYLSRDEKLSIIKRFESINGIHREKKWALLQPNKDHDWINQRDPAFYAFLPLGDKEVEDAKKVFETFSLGVVTGRDSWVYNMSSVSLEKAVKRMIATYNEERKRYQKACAGKSKDQMPEVEEIVDADPKKISWTRALKADAKRGTELRYDAASIIEGMYRPFVKQWMYFNRRLNEMVLLMPSIFPSKGLPNRAICISAVGNRVDFSVLMSNALPDLHMADKNGASQCFPFYLYEKAESEDGNLFDRGESGEVIDGYRRRHAITDATLSDYRTAYEAKVTKDDVFCYVYGILHSPEYRTRFAADLKKMLPRIPLTRETSDFWRFTEAGRQLAHWHLNYETVEPYPVKEHRSTLQLDSAKDYLVQKMTFGRTNKQIDKSTIVYNANLTLLGIPLEAYDYVVNGKPAIEWIMERYQVTVDKDSGIRNDPNDWAREHNEPRYIVDLLKRIVRVSLETMKIVRSLPALNERTAPQPVVAS